MELNKRKVEQPFHPKRGIPVAPIRSANPVPEFTSSPVLKTVHATRANDLVPVLNGKGIPSSGVPGFELLRNEIPRAVFGIRMRQARGRADLSIAGQDLERIGMFRSQPDYLPRFRFPHNVSVDEIGSAREVLFPEKVAVNPVNQRPNGRQSDHSALGLIPFVGKVSEGGS